MTQRSLRKGLLGVLGAAIVLLLVGAAYQKIAETRDLELYPPAGKLVDVGGFRLHLDCQGVGRPTVIVEAGMGNYSLGWRTVQRAISPRTQICLYDRAGIGWSDADREPPTAERVAANLWRLVNNAGIEGPFVMVGHSAGGIFVRQFTYDHPSNVAGIVLVDSSHENQAHRLPREFREAPDPLGSFLKRCRIAAPFGIIRVFGVIDRRLPASMPSDIRSVSIALANRTHFCPSMLDAWRTLQMHWDSNRPLPRLGDIPLIVLTAGRGLVDRASEIQIDLSPELLEQRDATWMELQSELASLSSNSEHRVVPNAGHFVHIDRLDAVVDAIENVFLMTKDRE